MIKSAIKRMAKRQFLKCHNLEPWLNASYQQLLLHKALELYGVDTIFDIGANSGMSADLYRSIGFSKKIVSFEPIKYLYEELEIKSSNDPLWFIEQLALGDAVGHAEINVSGGHAGGSSLLQMTDNVKTSAPDQCVVRKENIIIDTLDNMMEKYYPEGDRCFLKMDVQGFEQRVIEGGMKHLDKVIGLKIEMSLVENYVDESLFLEMVPLLYSLGLRLVSLENGWCNINTKEIYQVDGLFFRTDAI